MTTEVHQPRTSHTAEHPAVSPPPTLWGSLSDRRLRKYTHSILVQLISGLLCWAHVIPPEVYATIALGVTGSFTLGNVGEWAARRGAHP